MLGRVGTKGPDLQCVCNTISCPTPPAMLSFRFVPTFSDVFPMPGTYLPNALCLSRVFQDTPETSCFIGSYKDSFRYRRVIDSIVAHPSFHRCQGPSLPSPAHLRAADLCLVSLFPPLHLDRRVGSVQERSHGCSLRLKAILGIPSVRTQPGPHSTERQAAASSSDGMGIWLGAGHISMSPWDILPACPLERAQRAIVPTNAQCPCSSASGVGPLSQCK